MIFRPCPTCDRSSLVRDSVSFCVYFFLFFFFFLLESHGSRLSELLEAVAGLRLVGRSLDGNNEDDHDDAGDGDLIDALLPEIER